MTNSRLRVFWTVVGLVLTAIGVVGLIASLGHLAGVDEDAPLLWSGLLNLWRDINPWGLIILGVLGALLAWLGFHLLGRQLRPGRGPGVGDLDLRTTTGPTAAETELPPGATRVRGARLVRGLERDLARDPQVHKASVTLAGTPPRPELWIELRLSSRAGLAAVREHVTSAVERFRATSGLDPSRLEVTARIDSTGAARVR
ncbi:Asp23/Gls24 family envelope stress response protein [Plantactinospora sonchi]|uniref:Alkaline shock response membrane anchor protein AmaP n=1 Tax=Plantactinospora sonchi TaxID=1544735 RepID=A0ABU7S406_9ACTN